MKFVHPEIETVFDTSNGFFNTLVIESQDFFVQLLTDLHSQIAGKEGVSVLSDNNQLISFSKHAVLLDTFVPFDLNRKSLCSKILSAMDRKANEPELFEKTAVLLTSLENYLDDLSLDIPCETVFTDISVSALLKALGFQLNTDHEPLSERILNYIELVTEYDHERLFFLVNVRSYINDEEMTAMIKDILLHGYSVISIESSERALLENEFRVLIDNDLCEII